MEPETVRRIVDLLHGSARKRQLLTYQRFHSMFEPDVPLRQRYHALAGAVRILTNGRALDYGVLLMLDNGMPGPEFFERFRRSRPEAYAAVMGLNSYRQSFKKKNILARSEREKVFNDARSNDMPLQSGRSLRDQPEDV